MRINWIEITTKIGCKNNCSYCPQTLFLKRYRNHSFDTVNLLTLEKFQQVLAKLPPRLEICFAGLAEPFENPDALKMVQLAAQAAHPVSIYTSLRGISIEDLAELCRITLTDFVVHIPDQEGYMNLTCDKEHLKKLHFLLKANPKNLSFMCIGTPDAAAAKLLGFRLHVEKPCNRAGNLKSGQYIKQPEIKYPIVCNRRLANPSRTLPLDYTENTVLLPDGRVILCCMDYGMKHVLGNLFEQTYDEILNSAEMMRVRAVMSGKQQGNILCQECSFVMDHKSWRCTLRKLTGWYFTPVYPFIRNSLIRLANRFVK